MGDKMTPAEARRLCLYMADVEAEGEQITPIDREALRVLLEDHARALEDSRLLDALEDRAKAHAQVRILSVSGAFCLDPDPWKLSLREALAAALGVKRG